MKFKSKRHIFPNGLDTIAADMAKLVSRTVAAQARHSRKAIRADMQELISALNPDFFKDIFVEVSEESNDYKLAARVGKGKKKRSRKFCFKKDDIGGLALAELARIG